MEGGGHCSHGASLVSAPGPSKDRSGRDVGFSEGFNELFPSLRREHFSVRGVRKAPFRAIEVDQRQRDHGGANMGYLAVVVLALMKATFESDELHRIREHIGQLYEI